MKWRIYPPQRGQVNRLVRRRCCCYDHGSCILLDGGEPHRCVQVISRSDYFLRVVCRPTVSFTPKSETKTNKKENVKMKKYNDLYVIGIDHGYGNMKTANCCFPTGVLKSETEPVFTGDLLAWDEHYYSIGVGHKEFMADKFNDEGYYVLTLAAIARELRR